MIFKLIYYIILFYLIYKLLRYLGKSLAKATRKNSEVYDSPKKPKVNIRKEDIIEAEFEEIPDEKEEKGN